MTRPVLQITAHGARVRMRDTGGKISRCMRRGVPYERPLLEHIYQQRFTGVAVDAGANIGNHTLWFSQVCGLDVVAFEPLHHELLAEHVRMNRAQKRVRIETVALGDHTSTATHVGKGRLDPDASAEPSAEPDVAAGQWIGSGANLPVRTLDSYQLPDVDVIKADIEGMEAMMLAGARATIRRHRPVVFAEEWGRPEHEAIASVLHPLGYALTRRFSGKGSRTPVGRWDYTAGGAR
ncbi:FkbM family methyltransferase [Streptomonospora litoralis]|uniref:Methyltransferase FkbM domain-containing protein n=1 Tax=Streptomonospora litoralis TaxID=2498135 RepID=A0A4P6Q7L0_9ACTN|nr:FkbM family methyltransferase [Streptomonospora litoralis]QBI56786.1 hypothetical protein EKD16_25225 [Streptomonospora litoralis]